MIETNTKPNPSNMRLTHTQRSEIIPQVRRMTIEQVREAVDILDAEFRYSELTDNSYYGYIQLPNQKTRYGIVIRPAQSETRLERGHSVNTGRNVTHQPTIDKIYRTFSEVISK